LLNNVKNDLRDKLSDSLNENKKQLTIFKVAEVKLNDKHLKYQTFILFVISLFFKD
jgi:hypothetical protein